MSDTPLIDKLVALGAKPDKRLELFVNEGGRIDFSDDGEPLATTTESQLRALVDGEMKGLRRAGCLARKRSAKEQGAQG